MGAVENYHYYKDRNRCVQCRKQDAFTLNGRSFCAECVSKYGEYRKKYEESHAEELSQRRKAQREYRAANGLCTKCGRPLEDSWYKTCPKCRARSAKAKREENSRKGKPTIDEKRMRSFEGYCYKCGEPAMEGENVRGTSIRLCPRCYEDACLGLRRGNESLRQKNGGRMVFIQDSYVTISRGKLAG